MILFRKIVETVFVRRCKEDEELNRQLFQLQGVK